MRCLDCKFFSDGEKEDPPRTMLGWCDIKLPPHIDTSSSQNNIGRAGGCDIGQAIPMQMPKSSIIEKIIDRKTSEGRGT